MKTVGIVGDGQLAQLLAHAAYQLGLNTLCYAEKADCPAARTSPVMVGALSDHKQLASFAQQVDVITLENENIPEEAFDVMLDHTPVWPSRQSLATSQDRLFEKRLFTQLGIKTPQYAEVSSLRSLQDAVEAIGAPSILKTRRFGYDGKGQVVMHEGANLVKALGSINEYPAVLEQMVSFSEEVSLISVRNVVGEMVHFPLMRNEHREGILRVTRCSEQAHPLQEQAETYITKLMQNMNYVGVLAFEFFVVDGQLVANEIAPRVHNSGHVTTEGCNVSQFELHLRAVTGMPLVEPVAVGESAMINIIGGWPAIAADQVFPGVHVYNYGKSPRPGRKLGHVNVLEISDEHFAILNASASS